MANFWILLTEQTDNYRGRKGYIFIPEHTRHVASMKDYIYLSPEFHACISEHGWGTLMRGRMIRMYELQKIVAKTFTCSRHILFCVGPVECPNFCKRWPFPYFAAKWPRNECLAVLQSSSFPPKMLKVLFFFVLSNSRRCGRSTGVTTCI